MSISSRRNALPRLVQVRCGRVCVLLTPVVFCRITILGFFGLKRRKFQLQLQDKIVIFSITDLHFLTESLQVLNVLFHGQTFI